MKKKMFLATVVFAVSLSMAACSDGQKNETASQSVSTEEAGQSVSTTEQKSFEENVPQQESVQQQETVPQQEVVQQQETVPQQEAVQQQETVPQQETVQQQEIVPQQEAVQQEAVLYIGTKESGFAEYPMSYEGALTADMLIEGIAKLTNWDLTLAEPVISGKGGISICFAASSSIYMGPPEVQKEEFHMFDSTQLIETIQDSVRKTLQEGLVGEGGDPEALEIFYYDPEE